MQRDSCKSWPLTTFTMATRLATAMIAPRVASTTRVVTAMACGGGSGSVSVAGPRCALRNLRTPFAVRMVVSPAHASTRFGAGRAFTTLHRAPRWGRYAHAVDATGARCLVGRATGAASRQLWRGTVSSVRGLSVRATAPRAMRPTYGQRCGDAGGQRASNGGRQGPDNNAGSTGQNPGGQATGVWAAVVWPFRTVRNWWRHHSARLKNVFKTYGTVAFGTYFGSYFVTLVSSACRVYACARSPSHGCSWLYGRVHCLCWCATTLLRAQTSPSG